MAPTDAPTPQQLVEHALATTGADECIVIVKDTTSANLRWANNTLTTNGVMHANEVTVISFHHRAEGVATASVTGSATTLDQVTGLVRSADAGAHGAAAAEDAAELVAASEDPSWEHEPERTDIGIFTELAPRLGEAFERASRDSRILYGFLEHQLESTYLGSSTGLRRRHVQPTGHVTCTAKTADLQHSAWVGRATPDFADIDPLAIESDLATRLSWASRSVELPAGRYDTVLPPEAVADLMIYALATAGARDAHDGQSVYGHVGGGTRIGEPIARSGVRLYSDPGDGSLPAAPFVVAPSSSDISSVFDNGLPLHRTEWISDGELGALLQTRNSARLTGQPTTPMVGNLIVDTGGTATLAEVISQTERGLLLTCLWYIRMVDPQSLLLTGLTRDGVYLIESGEIVGSVNNFRFNESPIDLLNRFTACSETSAAFSREWGEYFPWVSTPALRVPDFNMSSVSQAT